MEKKIIIESGICRLEGYWQSGAANKGVVITHPHPLYGGSMHNPVVETIQGAYQNAGYATLRFNFRGVGGSQGNFDNGIGEQNDVRAAIAAVQKRGVSEVALAGYSFGAWVNARLVATDPIAIASMLMVSPPVAFLEFGEVSTLNSLQLVVTGNRDDIAPAERIRALLPLWNSDAHLEIIDGCDHFYIRHIDKLESILTAYLQNTV